MNTLIVEGKDKLWHERPYGTKTTLCGQQVDPDVSPGISQLVFERLHGEKAPRCSICETNKAMPFDRATANWVRRPSGLYELDFESLETIKLVTTVGTHRNFDWEILNAN